MANYHLSIKIFSRGNGHSAIEKAAYRAGEKLLSDYNGKLYDYTRKGGVAHTEILLPDHAPHEYADRSVLWNAVENSERNSNAQLAREIEFSLPRELSIEQNIKLTHEFVKKTFVSAGMCADVCVHDKGDGNPHAHVMLTLRPIEPDGHWGAKSKKDYILDENGERIRLPSGEYKSRKVYTVDWNEQTKAEDWRAAWEDIANAELERQGFDGRIDHRSYERQGIDQAPTVHLGPAASQMERKGIHIDRGDMNRAIEVTNKELKRLRARIVKLEKWIAEETANIKPPTLADVIINILERRGLHNLQSAAKILVFLQENQIPDLSSLEQKVKSMYGKVQQLREDMKPINHRIDTLKEHIRHSENFKNYRKIKWRYDELYSLYETAKKATGFGAERKAQKALYTANEYYETHRSEIAMFDNAEKYLRDVLQGRFDPKKLPPITKWREELVDKTAEQEVLYRQYDSLKNATQKVEQIRRSITEIMQSESQRTQPTRTQGMEL